MEYIPVFFFGVLFLYILKKKRFDVSAYITLLYLITSFFSLLMFRLDLVDRKYSNPSFFATVTYCFLLFVSIVPIYRLHLQNLELIITPRVEKTINYITYFFFLHFVIFLFIKSYEIYQILVNGNFGALRQEIMSDDVVEHASGIKGLFGIVTNIMSSISFVMILVFFISVSYFKKSWFFNLAALLGSFPQVLNGVISVNRSNVFYYVIIFGLCIVLFWKKIPRRIVVRYFPPIAAAFVAMMLFFSLVTIDRFENDKTYGGVNNALISYAGMPYSNFCYFFDYYNNPDWTSTRFLFPVTNYIFNNYRAGTIREQEQSAKTGFNCVVFMTFLGSFIMDSNRLMPVIFLMIYLFLFHLCKIHIRHHSIPFFWLLIVFFLAIIPAVGCISYFYTSPFRSMALYALLFLVSKQ